MLAASRYIILLLLLMYAPVIRSQNITGSWEGLMKDEFLQLNIVQEKDDALCGYTFDHLLTDKKSYCIAYFTGHYNKYQKSGDISGVAFLKNSGTHLLMSIRFFEDKIRGEKVLVAMVSSKSTLDFFLSFGVRETVILTRVGNVPARLPDNLPVCFPEPESRKEKPLPKTNPAKPIMPDTLVKKPEVIIPPADTISVVRIPKKDSLVFDKELLARKNTTFSRIPVTSKYIELHVYDNAIIDDDTVSIFYNSKKLISKQ